MTLSGRNMLLVGHNLHSGRALADEHLTARADVGFAAGHGARLG